MIKVVRINDRRNRLRYFDDPPENKETENKETENKETEKKETEGKRFTQDEVNRMIKADKDRTRKENEKLLNQLKQINENGLTPEAKTELEQRIAALEDEGKTKEQLQREEKERLTSGYEKKIKEKDMKLSAAERRYADYRTQIDIMSAASSKDVLGENVAINPQQIVTFLKPQVLMEEEIVEGKPTGELVPRVKWRAKDEEGKDVELKLSVTDAVKRMSEQPEHSNLFSSGARSGLGGYTQAGSSNGKIPDDTAAYMAARKKNKTQINASRS